MEKDWIFNRYQVFMPTEQPKTTLSCLRRRVKNRSILRAVYDLVCTQNRKKAGLRGEKRSR